MDIQTEVAGGSVGLLGMLGFFARSVYNRFERVERTFITASAVAALLKASEDRFTALVGKSDERVEFRHLETSNNLRELRLLSESTNGRLFELAKQKQP